jgi:hypothetical protein
LIFILYLTCFYFIFYRQFKYTNRKWRFYLFFLLIFSYKLYIKQLKKLYSLIREQISNLTHILGSAVPTITKDGLQGIQQPLRERYPAHPADSAHQAPPDAKGIDAWYIFNIF